MHEQFLRGLVVARASARKAGTNRFEEDLLDAVGMIYEAALEPGLWPAALSRVAGVCGATWTPFSVIPLNSTTPATTFQNPHVDPERLALMTQRFMTPDTNPSIPVMLASPLGRINLREESLTDREWERIEMYNEAYRPIGLYASLAVPLLRSSHCFAAFGAVRARSRGDFERNDLSALSRLIPHLQRAVSVMLRLDTLGTHAAAVQDAWNRLSFGIMTLDAKGRLLWTNRAGERILMQNDGLCSSGGRLHARPHSVNAELQRLVGEAGLTTNGHGLQSGGATVIPRNLPAHPLSLIVSPIRIADGGGSSFSNPGTPAVLVLVNDPDQIPDPPRALLRQLYRLTEREAALAALLLEGCDLREAGEKMGVGIGTVRTHLRQLFEKTDTRRQAGLVRLLLRSAVAIEGG